LQRSQRERGNPFATGQSNKVLAGLGGKIGLTNDLTLDLTVNPDFGQVEADPSEMNPLAVEFANRFHVFGADEIQRVAGQYLVDAHDDGVTDYRFGTPSFGFRQFRSNLVVRWE
jgi:hypothetical protein